MDMTVYIANEHTPELADTLPPLRTTWLSLSPATVELDCNFRIRNWSQSTEIILGYQANEVIGQNLDLIVNRSDFEPVETLWQELLETGKTITCCVPCIDKSGQLVGCEGEFSVESVAGQELCFLTLSDLDFASPVEDSLDSMLDDLSQLKSPWLIY